MSIFMVVGLWPSFGIEVFGVRMPLGDGDGGFKGIRHIRNIKGEERTQTLTYYFVAEGGGCLSLRNVGKCL
jgi:hypothetical protein